MSYVNWQDPGTREIRSTDISGLQEIVSKLERSVGMETVSETNIPLTEVYISENDRWRIFQAPEGKRNWVDDPAPVIKKDGVAIDSGFVIDYGAGAIILSTNDTEEHTYTADATYVAPLVTDIAHKISNPEYSSEQSVVGGIGSMPENAVEGNINDVVIEGLTATNLVKNGNFANGTTNWSASGATLSANNNILSITHNGNYSSANAQQIMQHVKGRKLFGRMIARVTNPNCSSIRFYINTPNSRYFEIISNPIQYQWYILRGIVTIESDDTQSVIQIMHDYADASTGSGKVMEVKEVMIIELQGEDLDFSVDQLNQKYSNWFDGTKSVLASLRKKTVGKNLFTVNLAKKYAQDALLGYGANPDLVYEGCNSFKFTKTYAGIGFLIKAKPNTQYAVSFNYKTIGATGLFKVFNDFNLNGDTGTIAAEYLVANTSNRITRVFTTNRSGHIKLAWGSGGNNSLLEITNIQLEEGVSVTNYEEYKETVQYISAKDSQGNLIELRSLPNGVKDAINTQKYKLIKRVSNEVIINGSSSFSQSWFSDSIEGIYLCPILNWATNNNAAQNGRNDVIATSSDGNYQNYGDYESNKKCIYFKNGHLYLGIEKSKVDAMSGSSTFEKFINYLNQYPITLIYQLASPVEIPVTIDGVLQAFEDGSIYIEPYLKEEFSITGTSINLPIPISAIDKIEILQNNVWTEATGTLSSDGKTITVSTSGKYRVFGPIFASESLIPEVTYTVPVNLKAQVDSNTKAITVMSKSIIDLNDKVDILLILNS